MIVGGRGKLDQNLAHDADPRFAQVFIDGYGVKLPDDLSAHFLESKVIQVFS